MNMKGNCLAGLVLSATQTLLSLLTVNSITGNTGAWLMITLTDNTIAKKIRWYREHGYYDCLIQTWGGGWGDRDLRGQVLAELSKLRKPKRRKRVYKPVFRLRKHKGKKRGWIIPLALILALLFLGAFFSSLEVPAPVVTKSEVPEAISRKREPEKELQAVKSPHLIAEEVQAEESAREKKEKTEVFYMGIKISR